MLEDITFFSEKKIKCPACNNDVEVEILRQGRGRLNSDTLCDDLRRTYIPSRKFGPVYPFIYTLKICDHCWFASLDKDFHNKAFHFSKIKDHVEQRKLRGQMLIKSDEISFKKPRDLKTALLGYYLAAHSYAFYKRKVAVEFFQGLMSLRASWCAQDLGKTEQDKDFMVTSLFFRYMAALKYENFISSIEAKPVNENIDYYGPDSDHDFGFKGGVYLSALLGVEFGELIVDNKDRSTFYSKLLLRLSRVFGIGIKNKSSPSPFLEKVYNLYSEIKEINKHNRRVRGNMDNMSSENIEE